MNRAERRRQAKLVKKSVEQMAKIPKCHLHDKYTQQDLDKTKEQVKEFLKTYDYKGSNYEDIVPIEKAKREYCQSLKGDKVAIRLEKDFRVIEQKTGKVIKTDIFLIKSKKGCFLSYENLDFQQNILVSIHELGLPMVMSNRDDVAVVVREHIIPIFNRVVRQAFDSLSLKYDDKWVA